MHISKCTSFGCKFKEIITREGSSSTTLLNSMLDNFILGWYQALQILNNMCIKINALPLHIIPSYTWIIWADEWDKLHSLLLVCFVFFGCQIFCMKGIKWLVRFCILYLLENLHVNWIILNAVNENDPIMIKKLLFDVRFGFFLAFFKLNKFNPINKLTLQICWIKKLIIPMKRLPIDI